jgi:RNA polymerase sigma-70 factor (ECF subfamily)
MSAASSSIVEAQVALSAAVDDVQADFEALYREYFGFAWASLRRLGVPNAAIDDAAQDLWVTVHRRLDSYDPDASMKAWIFGIARRVASHYRRTAQRNARKIAALSFSDQRRSDQPIGRREIALTMETFLGRLDECKRVAFVLSELEGWSAPEIARVAGTNANTIYSRIRLAKQQLRDHFAAADAEAYVDQAIEEAKVATRPPRGAAKHCWIGLLPKLGGTSGTAAAATGIGAAWAKLKFVALGAMAGSVGLVGVDAALPEAPASVHAAAPVEVAVERPAPARPKVAPAIAPRAATAAVIATPSVVPEAPVQRPSTPAPRVKPERVAPAPEPVATPAPSVASNGLDPAETKLLTDARRVLAGDPNRALDLAGQHAQRFPTSRLSDVRDAIEIDALCADGQADAARTRASRVLAKNPGSAAAKRALDGCQG